MRVMGILTLEQRESMAGRLWQHFVENGQAHFDRHMDALGRARIALSQFSMKTDHNAKVNEPYGLESYQ